MLGRFVLPLIFICSQADFSNFKKKKMKMSFVVYSILNAFVIGLLNLLTLFIYIKDCLFLLFPHNLKSCLFRPYLALCQFSFFFFFLSYFLLLLHELSFKTECHKSSTCNNKMLAKWLFVP